MKNVKLLLLFAISTLYALHTSAQGDIYPVTCPSGGFAVFDNNCNMYYIDDNGYIKEMDAATGAITTLAGTGTSTYNGDGPVSTTNINPYYLAIDNAGNIYFSDYENSLVREVYYDAGWQVKTVAGYYTGPYGFGYNGDGIPATSALLAWPVGIALDNSGNLYIADNYNARIRIVNLTSGIITTFAGSGSPWGYSGDGGLAVDAKLGNPWGIKFNSDKSVLYIVDNWFFLVRSITMTSNIIKLVAGVPGVAGYNGDGIAANTAYLNYPTDVAADNAGNVYIADASNGRIREVNSAGIINTVAGNGTTGSTVFYGPAVATNVNSSTVNIDPMGNIFVYGPSYVCENNPPLVSSLSITSTGSTVCAGTLVAFTANIAGSGCGATAIQWYKNGAVITGATGNTYIESAPTSGETIQCTASVTDAILGAYCSSGNVLTSNTITLTVEQAPYIAGIDINDICAPGLGFSAPVPTFSVTVVGGTPHPGSPPYYDYDWGTDMLGNTSLNNSYIAHPYIQTAVSPYAGYYVLTVHDANFCSDQIAVPIQLETSGWDLASKDNPYDLYMEPFLASSSGAIPPFTAAMTNIPREENVWYSPDIWNSYSATSTSTVNQPPKTPGSNYLYTNIRNVGCVAFTDSIKEYVDLYWTLGGIGGEYWSDPDVDPDANYWLYNGSAGIEIPGVGPGGRGALMPVGTQITPDYSILIPDINAGSSTVIGPIPWSPPVPNQYFSLYATSLDLCLLSRIVDFHNSAGGYYLPNSIFLPGDPNYGMTYLELDGDPSKNIRNNNNIITLNTAVIGVSHSHMFGPVLPPSPHYLYTGNLLSGIPVSLQFINNFSLNPGTGTSVLNNYMSYEIYLGKLFDVWQAAGAYGSYPPGTIDYGNKGIIFDGTNTVRLDSIVMDSGAMYQVEIQPSYMPGADPSLMPSESFYCQQIMDDGSDLLIGNFTYSVQYTTPCQCHSSPGVLTMSEISLGPVSCPGSNYAAMLVSNCGTHTCNTVNIQGWVLNDNDGSFDTAGCSISYGVTQSHYRLAYDSIWANVPVGSIIIAYNVDSSCYGFPDTFTIQTILSPQPVGPSISYTASATGGPGPVLPGLPYQVVYFVPIGSPELYPVGKEHLQRYMSLDSAMWCDYTIDSSGDTTISDSMAYAAAYAWDSTIAFDSVGDAFQVRCPRCDRDMRNEPAFYHGIGYGPTDAFNTIPGTPTSLGGPVIPNSGDGYKYTFTGSTAADLGDPTKWQVYAADAAGAIPPSVVAPSNGLLGNVLTNNLNPPCCSAHKDHGGAERKTTKGNGSTNGTTTNPTVNNPLGLSVFPNPATMTVNFSFPASPTTEIKITDVTGRLMDYQVVTNSTTATFDVHNYAPGIYLYQVTMTGKVQTGKLVVE